MHRSPHIPLPEGGARGGLVRPKPCKGQSEFAPLSNRRAFSLVEAVISTVIVATMFAAAISATGIAAKDRRIQAEQRTAGSLAKALMSEIVANRYVDPTGGTTLGLDGESTSTRAQWNDIDDYNGFKESTLFDKNGNKLPGLDGWVWGASVEYFTIPSVSAVTSSTPQTGSLAISVTILGIRIDLGSTTLAAPTDTGMKRIIVSVTSPRGVKTRLSALRSAWGSANDIATGGGVNTWTGITIQTGPENRATTAATQMLNRPQP